MQTSGQTLEGQILRQWNADLGARVLLHRLAAEVRFDAFAFTVLLHAELYLAGRRAYEADRAGMLAGACV